MKTLKEGKVHEKEVLKDKTDNKERILKDLMTYYKTADVEKFSRYTIIKRYLKMLQKMRL